MVTVLPAARHLRRSAPPLPRPGLSLPSYEGRRLQPGVVHLGVGRFHRAHQARYFDEIAERRISTRWGLVGAGLRSVRTKLTLAAQDQLFTVVEARSDRPTARVVGVLQDFLFAPRERARLVRQLAHEDTRLVTLTVTAEAYRDPVGAPGSPSAFELLVEALDVRRRSGLAPFTVLSCDNLPGNGVAAASAVRAAAEAADRPGLSSWIERHVAFPSAMVDRITVTPDDVTRSRLRHELGIVDPCAVLTEPSAHWVVEDTFCNERPPLEEVGVELVSDVGPFQAAKTRLLNASHCAVGYLGHLAGHTTATEVLGDPVMYGFVEELLTDVTPLLAPVPAWDLRDYGRSVLERIANPRLSDHLSRLTRRGSVRIPSYVQPSLLEAVRGGHDHRRLALVVAAWVVHLRDTPPSRLDDPAAHELGALARAQDLDPLLRHPFVCGDAAESSGLVAEVKGAVEGLDRFGVHATVRLLAQPTGKPSHEVDIGWAARARYSRDEGSGGARAS